VYRAEKMDCPRQNEVERRENWVEGLEILRGYKVVFSSAPVPCKDGEKMEWCVSASGDLLLFWIHGREKFGWGARYEDALNMAIWVRLRSGQ
jgi:hypothetical protein